MAAADKDPAKIADRFWVALQVSVGKPVPAVQALMAEAWLEGAEAAVQRERASSAEAKARFVNPYLGGGK